MQSITFVSRAGLDIGTTFNNGGLTAVDGAVTNGDLARSETNIQDAEVVGEKDPRDSDCAQNIAMDCDSAPVSSNLELHEERARHVNAKSRAKPLHSPLNALTSPTDGVALLMCLALG